MKILYIAQDPRKIGYGVSQKIYGQCKALTDLGHQCKLLLFRRTFTELYEFDKYPDRNSFFSQPPKVTEFKRVMREFSGRIKAFLLLLFPSLFLSKISDFTPDIIYVRNLMPLNPLYLSFLKRIKKKSKIFWELPTYPYKDEIIQLWKKKPSISLLPYFIFDFRAIERIQKISEQFIVVSEIDDMKARERLGNYIIIPNGFDVASVPVKQTPPLYEELNILGVSNLAAWHGYDRVVSGIAKYQGKYKVFFHLVSGIGADEAELLKQMALELGVSDNIIFYGQLNGDALNSLFDKCHVAVESLGIHRKHLKKSATLKSREYCSRGIPFFTSSEDEEFEDSFKFRLKFEASDNPIDIHKVCEFAENNIKIKDYAAFMREYAEKNLDWKNKMEKLIGGM